MWNPPAEGSLAQAIAKAAPGARVIKGFNTFGAEFHADPSHAGAPAQVFFAGDDADAKKTFAEVATKGGWRPVDAGRSATRRCSRTSRCCGSTSPSPPVMVATGSSSSRRRAEP